MFFVVSHLLGPAPVGLFDGALHAVGNLVGIHDYFAIDISGGAACSLRQTPVIAQEAFLVGIEYGHKTHLRQVESFAQEIDSYEHIVKSLTEIIENAHSFESVDIAVDVRAVDAPFLKVTVEFLGHSLGEGGDKNPLVVLFPDAYLFHQVIYLVHRGPDLDFGVEKSRGSDHLLHEHTFRLFQFIVAGSGADVYHLRSESFEFLEFERSVVDGGGEPESILHEIHLAREVTAVHAPYLRQCDMAFIYDRQEILGEIVEQTERTRSRFATVEVAGIVFYSAAMP